jgi:hypothetical protein
MTIRSEFKVWFRELETSLSYRRRAPSLDNHPGKKDYLKEQWGQLIID